MLEAIDENEFEVWSLKWEKEKKMIWNFILFIASKTRWRQMSNLKNAQQQIFNFLLSFLIQHNNTWWRFHIKTKRWVSVKMEMKKSFENHSFQNSTEEEWRTRNDVRWSIETWLNSSYFLFLYCLRLKEVEK